MASPASSQPCDAIPKNPNDSASTSKQTDEGICNIIVRKCSSGWQIIRSWKGPSMNTLVIRFFGQKSATKKPAENTDDNVLEGESEPSNISSRITEGGDILTPDIDTSRTDENGFTYSTGCDADQEIARLQQEFQDKQIAVQIDYERRMKAMRKRYARQMEATYSDKNAEDDNFEISPKKPYEFTETKYTGLCIIINNNTKYLREAAYLRKFFAVEGYEVEYRECLKKEEIESIFNSLRLKNFDNYGCFVCFVLSTGNDTYIETADNLSIKMSKIVEYFNPNNNCPSKLKGKPKIFFFQIGLDFYDAKNLWETDDNETTPFPSYADAFVVRSTLRDFIDKFVIILSDHPGKSLSTIMAILQSETLPLFTRNEQYQVISTMAKEVYFAAEKSEVKTSNTHITGRIPAPMEEELNESTEENTTAGPSSDNSNATADVGARTQEEVLSDTTEPVEGPLSDISNVTAKVDDMPMQEGGRSETTKPNEDISTAGPSSDATELNEENSTVGPPNDNSNETLEPKVTTKPIAENSTAGHSSDDSNTTPGVDTQEGDSRDTKKPKEENSSVGPPNDDSNDMAEQEETTKTISGNSTPVPSGDISTATPDVGTSMREEGSTNTTTIPKQEDSTVGPPGDNSNGTTKQEVIDDGTDSRKFNNRSDDSNATPDVDTPTQGEESNEGGLSVTEQ
ncbi:uncharacterized protein LOC120333219 isoform X2 [Styela clava]